MKWNDFVLTVTDTSKVAANLLRLEFEVDAEAGEGYQPIDAGDEAITLYLSSDEHALETRRSDDSSAFGGWELVEPERCRGGRNYTVRGYEQSTRRMIVDIAEHDHGPAMNWLKEARPGWKVLAAGPRSWYSPPADARRHILAGDLAALPALARILENTDPSIEMAVIAEVADRSEIEYLPQRDNAEVIPLIGSGNGISPGRLADALAKLELSSEDYLWFSGEAADTRQAKKHTKSLGWPRGRADIVGYWRHNAEEWEKRLEEKGSEKFYAVYTDAVAAGKSDEEAAEIYDQALEEAGL